MSETSKVTVNYFCVGALLIFVGCVLICSLGFTIVLPYELTKNWPEVKCRVLNSSYNPHLCSCEEGFGGLDQYYGNSWIYNRMALNIKPNDELTNLNESSQEGSDGGSITDRFFHPTCSSKFPCLQILVEYQFPSIAHEEKFQNVNSTQNFKISSDQTTTSPIDSSSFKNRSRRSYDQIIYGQPLVYNSHKYIHQRKRSRIIKRSISYLYGGELPADFSAATNEQVFNITTSTPQDDSRKVSLPKIGIGYLYRSWDDSFHSRCSLIECGDESWNVKENRKFRKEWGVPGKTFTCFYNPINHTVIIKEKTSPMVVMHAILWPSLSLLIGAIIWICLCCGCCKSGKDSNCKEKYKLVS